MRIFLTVFFLLLTAPCLAEAGDSKQECPTTTQKAIATQPCNLTESWPKGLAIGETSPKNCTNHTSYEKPVENKDILLYAGVLVTLLLGIANLYFTLKASKRTAFINTVTSERVKWLDKVRKSVSNLCALCNQWIYHPKQDTTPELQRQIEQLKSELKLQLNPDDKEDKEITLLLDRLPTWTQSMTPEEYVQLQSSLISATQAMLKREWDKVKDEAINGDLRK